MHKDLAVGKIYDGVKSGKTFPGSLRFYVNSMTFSTAAPACGKLLWKTLWIMWKTMSYQQIFPLFASSNSGEKSALEGFHNNKTGCGNVMLQAVFRMIHFLSNSYKKLKLYVKPLSIPGPKPSGGKIFC